MSRDTRFDKLESEIVDALRRAPGAAPSADVDARILARAHAAVARPARRPQPIWFSMAAGLVVLVGSGLALRIWQQLERAPSALDAPTPAASTPAPPASAPAPFSDDEVLADAVSADGAAADSSERAAPARAQTEAVVVAPAKPADQPVSDQPGAELRRESGLIESKLEVAPALSASPESADQLLPTPQARPFPAEPAPVITVEEASPATASSAPVAAAEMIAPAAPPPPPAAPPAAGAPKPATAPPPMQAPAPASDAGITQPSAVGRAETAKARSMEDAAAAGRDALAPAGPELDSDGERQRAAAKDPGGDAFALAVAAVREAVAAGDNERARRLANALRRDHPHRELPRDVLALVDAPR